MDNDTISRQAALNELTLMTEKHKGDTFSGELLHWTGIKTMIENLPSVQPEQKTGRWEIIGEEVGALNIKYPIKKCSECGWTHSLFIPENACPNCGAKMENGGNLFD